MKPALLLISMMVRKETLKKVHQRSRIDHWPFPGNYARLTGEGVTSNLREDGLGAGVINHQRSVAPNDLRAKPRQSGEARGRVYLGDQILRDCERTQRAALTRSVGC